MRHAAARAMGVRGRACADVRARIAPPEPKHAVAASVDPSSVPAYAREALDVLLKAGKQAFVVGGFVRDALRGVEAHDVDMTTDALWYQTRDIFSIPNAATMWSRPACATGPSPSLWAAARSRSRRFAPTVPTPTTVVPIPCALCATSKTTWHGGTSPSTPWPGALQRVSWIPLGAGQTLKITWCVRWATPTDASRRTPCGSCAAFDSRPSSSFAVEDETSASMHEHGADLAHVAIERIAVEYDGIVQGERVPLAPCAPMLTWQPTRCRPSSP